MVDPSLSIPRVRPTSAERQTPAYNMLSITTASGSQLSASALQLSSDNEQSTSRKRPSDAPLNNPLKKTSTTNPTGTGPPPTYQRAPRACVQCRQQKLRCLGGDPCERCVKSGQTCTFKPASGVRTGGQRKTNPRVDDTSQTGIPPTTQAVEPHRLPEASASRLIDPTDPTASSSNQGLRDLSGIVERVNQSSSSNPTFHHSFMSMNHIPNSNHDQDELPPPLYSRRIDPPRLGGLQQDGVSPELSTQHSDQTHTPSRSSILGGGQHQDDRASEKPAEESLYEAPFRSLLVEVSDYSLSNPLIPPYQFCGMPKITSCAFGYSNQVK
jgi:hypothetical protein